MLVVLGVLTYYVAPMSFIYKNFELFFLITNGILLMMILGMTFIAILLLPYLQLLVLNFILGLNQMFCYCCRDKRLKTVVKKNM